MITKLRGLLFPLLCACTAAHAQAPDTTAHAQALDTTAHAQALDTTAHAQVPNTTAEERNPNHFFFHPILTIVSLADDQVPLILQVTYERNLHSVGNSLIWQPQLTLGEAKDRDITVTQFGTAQYLGLRQYFGHRYGGFYVQGSGVIAFYEVGAKLEGDPNEANGTIDGVGALGYLGYKWAHVFLDFGVGYQGIQGDLTLDTGEEVSVANTGPLFDFNLGFGF